MSQASSQPPGLLLDDLTKALDFYVHAEAFGMDAKFENPEIWKINQPKRQELAAKLRVTQDKLDVTISALIIIVRKLIDAGVIEPVPAHMNAPLEYDASEAVLNALAASNPDSRTKAPTKVDLMLSPATVLDLHGAPFNDDFKRVMAEELDGYLGNLATRARFNDEKTYPLIEAGQLTQTVQRELCMRLDLKDGNAQTALRSLADEWLKVARQGHKFSWGTLRAEGENVSLIARGDDTDPRQPIPVSITPL